MHSPKLATVAGRPSGSNPNTPNKGKKNKQYLRISPLHRLVLVASYKRAKRAAAASSKKQIPTCVSLEELMRLTGVRTRCSQCSRWNAERYVGELEVEVEATDTGQRYPS